jgi:hypothetical protein
MRKPATITVIPVWVLYRGKIIISNYLFVPDDTALPFEQGDITIIAGAVKNSQFPPRALKPLKLAVQGEKLPEDLLMATANLRKHLNVLKETGRIAFKLRADGSLSVTPKEA